MTKAPIVTEALTLGIVGHVDHGKTALVRALTGIETDRLKEERERGLSIVLGFAFLETERGVVDLIDVPGHEDFIRAMIGGATALDGIVLCVAANEGVMPQTVEHFNIARLLGVERGCVVITKSDLVDDLKLADVQREVADCVRGTFLEQAPVLAVSAAFGDGVDAVRDVLAGFAATPVERDMHGPAFMPLDRVFTIRGFGLVATGTLRGGVLRVGDAVEIMPAARASTVRGLQNHHRSVEQAMPGQRVAVNLRHLSRDDVKRGDVLAAPGSVTPAKRIDTELRLLENAERGVKNGALVRFMTGTMEAAARIRLLGRRELPPGEAGFAQLDLDRDIATRVCERFLLRNPSPLQTLGGGRVLDVNAKRHRRYDSGVTARLETVASGDVERIVSQRLEESGGAGVRLAALAEELGAKRQAIAAIAADFGAVCVADDLAVAPSKLEKLSVEAVGVLERFHGKHPLRRGLDAGSLTNALGETSSGRAASLEVVQYVLRALVEQGMVANAGEIYSLAGHDPFAALGEPQLRLVRSIEQTFIAKGLEPPSPQAVVGADTAKQVILRLLLETGRLVRLKTYDRSLQIVLHTSTLEEAKQAIARAFPYPETFAVKDVRDLLHSTRRHVVPLMEHLDATGTTVRSGDLRRLREP